MSKFFELIEANFWVRNSLLALILAVLEQLLRRENDWKGVIVAFLISIMLYTWFVFHNRILLDRLLLKRSFMLYGFGLFLGLIGYALVMYSAMNEPYTLSNISKGAAIATINTFIGALFYFAYKYFKEQQEFTRNKLYLFEMEQAYLKNQLSPHFLFNTLNNIYSYSLIKSEKTSELILRLSELMRYLTQFNKENVILLSEEIDFIENYLAFEKERLEDRCQIDFKCQLPSDKIYIEPLLFFPLIENAFKHGTNTIDDCYVRIEIKNENGWLNVYIENKITSHLKPSTNSGIENVKKRLELFYPGVHQLNLNVIEQNFIASLNIKLQL